MSQAIPPPDPPSPRRSGGRKLRVLVVDDSMMNRFSIESVLRADPGIEVIGHAKNGEQALQLALGLKPDVITLDIEMPKMDGFTFLRILMSRMPIPVIVVSSYGNKETVFRALELGAVERLRQEVVGAEAEPHDRGGPVQDRDRARADRHEVGAARVAVQDTADITDALLAQDAGRAIVGAQHVDHQRLADGAAHALGLPGASPTWGDPMPDLPDLHPVARVVRDVRWAVEFFTPWAIRRIRGVSLGDGRSPKRPELTPVVAPVHC